MPTEIDAFEFTRSGRSADGCEPMGSLVRLASLLASPDGTLSWRLDGWRQSDATERDRMHLRLRASGTVGLSCGRCLGVVSLPIAIDRAYLLVQSESDAAALDESDDEFDALVASRQFAVHDLLEDEAILALPPSASHAECERPPQPGRDPSPPAEDRPRSPFAALSGLKTKPPT